MTNGLPREWMRGPQFASHEARAKWEPVLARARAAWAELEVLSVSAGIRPSALVYLTPTELPAATRDAARQGLEITPLSFVGDAGHRCAVHLPALRLPWVQAWHEGDDRTIGRLLGFPECCAAHFERNWVAERRTDTVLTQRTVAGPLEANVLLRQLGVRLVPHLPCSADCEASVDLGRAFAREGERVGIDVEALRVLLGLEVEYSALHGVACVSTEPFRFYSGTDYTETEVKLRRPGTTGEVDATWSDNGFSSLEAMNAAHAVLLEVAGAAESALDLGSGDGALLAKLAAGRAGHWYGLEVDAGRAARGRRRHPGVDLLTMDLGDVHSTLFPDRAPDAPRPFDVAFLMPGRLLEIGPEPAERLRAALRSWAARVVVYNYDGKPLAELCAAAGLPAPGPVTSDGATSAAVLGGF